MKSNAAVIIISLLVLVHIPGYSQDSVKYDNDYNSRARILKKDPDNFDVKFFRCINNNRSDFLSTFLTITDNSVLPVAVVLPISMFAYSRANDRTYDENSAVLMGFTEASSLALTAGLKFIVKRQRPYKTLKNVYVNKGILGDPYSFPSGHTSTTFGIATSLALRYPNYPLAYLPAYLWGLIVGYGRVYFGMHYPADVLGGAVLGSLSAIGVYSLRGEIIKFKNRVLGEENKPDANDYNSKSIGIISASYISAMIAGELLSSCKIEICPAANSREFKCSFRLSF